MSDTVLQIDVSGIVLGEASSLARRLLGVPGLEADAPPKTRKDRVFWGRAVRITVRVTSTPAEQGLSQALAGWLAKRRRAVTLRISFADGEVVELRGGTRAEEVARRIEWRLMDIARERLRQLEEESWRRHREREEEWPRQDRGREERRRQDREREERWRQEHQEDLDSASLRAEMLARTPQAFSTGQEPRRDAGDPTSDGESDGGPGVEARGLADLQRAESARDDNVGGIRVQLWAPYIGAKAVDEYMRMMDEIMRSVREGKASVSGAPTLPVTIYLSEEGVHGEVEAAIDELLDAAGLRIEDRDEPVIGSWFRRMRASVKEVIRSPAAREMALTAAHAADTRLVLAQDAAVTATLLQNLGPVIVSLQPTKDAVLRVGALLIVKVDWVVNVFQLTAAQQVMLDHQPRLALSPHEIIAALGLAASEPNDEGGRVPGIDGRL